MSALTQEFKNHIEQKISELESKSSLEIVPVISKRSSAYWKTRIFLSIIVFLCLLVAWRLDPTWQYPLETEIWICLAVSLIFFIFSFWTRFLKIFLPDFVKASAVRSKAEWIFGRENILKTKAGTGLLIFVSEFEHMVWVVADPKLAAAYSNNYFSDLGTKLAKDFNSQVPGDSFIQALEELNSGLASSFKVVGTANELSNEVREH